MEINCENCLCSKCDSWKECNDSIYGVENWCEVCNDLDIDHCYTEECHQIISEGAFSTHPLQIVMRGDKDVN